MSSEPTEKSELLLDGATTKSGGFLGLSKTKLIIIGVAASVAAVIILAVAIGVGVGVGSSQSADSASYSNAAVASDAAPCSAVGVEILRQKKGSAVDAAIATQLCLGVVNLHSTGIGGGGFMVYYNDTSREVWAIDFREKAPLMASPDMYNGTAPDSHIKGGLSIAIPGEIRGFEEAWERFGKLEWKELFEPAIKIARDGFTVTETIARAIAAVQDYLDDYPNLWELLAPDDVPLGVGDILKRPLLANTLEQIARNGASYFYEGQFMQNMVTELKEAGAIIQENDFDQYRVEERNVTMGMYNGYTVHGISAPGGGPVLSLILNILDGYEFKEGELNDLSIQRIVEAMKYAYGQRLKLGDPAFNSEVYEAVEFMLEEATADDMRGRITDNQTFPSEHYIDLFNGLRQGAHDHGTSHLSVLAENGDAVAMTNSINYFFGSLIRSNTSGIIFNDLMSDFSIPGRSDDFENEEVNYIEPGKRPLSSMTPTVITNDEGVKMVVGASGGARITTSVAQVILNVLGFELPLNDAIYRKRLHHQLIPNFVSVEEDFPNDFIISLEERGHTVFTNTSFAVVQGINVVDDVIFATSDPRKGGRPAGY